MNKSILKTTAYTVCLSLVYQLVFPVCTYALTTGPSTPEVQSFEPVGTTDMVNMFSGDFNYNIPLLDVEGYPVNIAYHSGINMEQEASWCGLGWNINPGELNRFVRGLPDDLNGDNIEKEINIKPERNIRVGAGGNASMEIAGSDKLRIGFSQGVYMNFNNYKGLSVGMTTGVTLTTPVVTAGVNMGIGTQTGVDIDVNAQAATSKAMGEASVGCTVDVGTGFNSRTGMKAINLGVGLSVQRDPGKGLKTSFTKEFSPSIPIGVQNYVPVVSNASVSNSFQFQLKVGGEIYWLFPSLYLNANINTINYSKDGTRKAYGYLYSENASKTDLLDYNRDKDGVYNKTLPHLPLSSMTYDIYSVSAQGSGGSFRPFRNDIGSIYDAENASTSDGSDALLEVGIGGYFSIGGDANVYSTVTRSGRWKSLPFNGKNQGSVYENVFFKSAGELTYNHQQNAPQVYNMKASYLRGDLSSLWGNSGSTHGDLPAKYNGASIYWDNSTIDRTSRADLLTYRTAEEASLKDVGITSKTTSFVANPAGDSKFFDPVENISDRYTANDFYLKKHQISEFTQTKPDGSRYIYGLPAINHASRETFFSVNENNADLNTGLVTYTPGSEDSRDNDKGRENLYTSTVTPPYAYSYMLTSILSDDYVDVTGDGPTDDDLGNFTKFNYSLKNEDYRWRAPYKNGKAQYQPGFYSDAKDGKGMYSSGSKQIWHVRSIETRNEIAEFYISERSDGKGNTQAILPGSSNMNTGAVNLKDALLQAGLSYKLDSIKLYNKHDRYINEQNAIPVKTVIFSYSYRLCPGTENSDALAGTYSGVSYPAKGKLTLEKIFIQYGNSQKNLLSPYVFSYNTPNPGYNFANKDRWGNFKQNNTHLTNYEFPYVSQNYVGGSDTLTAWNMTDIKLPSGGKIHVDYESDDYAYVQDKRAMQMFMIEGFGASNNLDFRNTLYLDKDNINDYLYFKRDISKEIAGISFRDNYFEGIRDNMLYYSINVDITCTGKYEHLKSYARVEEVGICPNNSSFGFIKLIKDKAGNMELHPATIYGLNTARYYLSHLLYPGYSDNASLGAVLLGLIGNVKDFHYLLSNPFKRFIDEGKAKTVRLNKSWIRLQRPGLTKRGGGVRVKQLTLTDNWTALSGSGADASYGKTYDYTIVDNHYGTISSGIASYEPFAGGDENPLRMPIRYTADGGRLLPKIDFFQEEPLGESFYPPAVVGYSSVKVRSVHFEEGRSSKSEDEYLFYTAKDYPITVKSTGIERLTPSLLKTLLKTYREEGALEGYALIFNDMHGKPKEINNYVINTNGSSLKKEKILGTTYNYQTKDRDGTMNNKVRAMIRSRGYQSKYEIRDDITLGQEQDFTVDSRQSYFHLFNGTIRLNLNVSPTPGPLPIPLPIPKVGVTAKDEEQLFHTMVTTKIIQQYGILKSVDHFDHGATTKVENLIWDAETGNPILTAVNNQYTDKVYNVSYPAYLSTSGMGAAYTNIDYEEVIDSMSWKLNYATIYDTSRFAFIYPKHPENFHSGDELLLTYRPNPAGGYKTIKVWVSKNFGQAGSPLIPGCRLTVEPRIAFQTGQPQNTWPDWTGYSNTVRNIKAKVLRSGRRNLLNATAETVSLTQNPYVNNIHDLLGNTTANGNAFNKVIQATAATYLDKNYCFTSTSRSFDTTYAVKIDSVVGADFVELTFSHRPDSFSYSRNDFINGNAGNYRKLSDFIVNKNRSYASNSRTDGLYSIIPSLPFYVDNDGDVCINPFSPAPNPVQYGWTQISLLQKYGLFGAALEEVDATGVTSAVQMGYNQQKPVAVTSNANRHQFFFEGFEDYSLLVPGNIPALRFNTGYLFTPFAQYFKELKDLQTSANINPTGGPHLIRRSGQEYSLLKLNNTAKALQIVKTNAHTGKYAIANASGSPTDVEIPIKAIDCSYNGGFALQPGRKYLVECWIKPPGTSAPTGGYQPLVAVDGNPVYLSVVTGSLDGWYKAQVTVDMRFADPATATMSFIIPQYCAVDDIRILPVDAAMKSFVYDPLTARLAATLDENHFASFYEYDAEGQLIRVKKETEKGIMTIQESRRSLSKKP